MTTASISTLRKDKDAQPDSDLLSRARDTVIIFSQYVNMGISRSYKSTSASIIRTFACNAFAGGPQGTARTASVARDCLEFPISFHPLHLVVSPSHPKTRPSVFILVSHSRPIS
jgi:hypothetical protein